MCCAARLTNVGRRTVVGAGGCTTPALYLCIPAVMWRHVRPRVCCKLSIQAHVHSTCIDLALRVVSRTLQTLNPPNKSRKVCLSPQGSDCSEPEFRGKLFDRCVNGCSRVGACVGGFCRCPAGRWGIDCSRTQVGGCLLVSSLLHLVGHCSDVYTQNCMSHV